MQFKKLKLYHYPATRSVRARWALFETVGDAFETKRVELYGAEQYSSEYLALNPNHNVPALEVHWPDGSRQVILESVAIVEWLADLFPDKRLAPPISSPASRAEYLQWLHFGGTWMDMMLWQIRAHRHILPKDDADPRTVARYEQKFRNEAEPQIAEKLRQSGFIVGDCFSAADIVVGHSVFWARGYGLCKDDIFTEYIGRLSHRSGFQQSLDDLTSFSLEPEQDAPVRERFSG